MDAYIAIYVVRFGSFCSVHERTVDASVVRTRLGFLIIRAGGPSLLEREDLFADCHRVVRFIGPAWGFYVGRG